MDEKQIKKNQIILSGIAIGIVIIVLIPVIYLWGEVSPKVADPIVLPDVDKIEAIEITTTDGTIATYTDEEQIEQILSILTQAAATSKQSIQDYPQVDKCGEVDILTADKGTTVYYYEQKGKHYIEQTYQGIYETNVDIDAFILGEATE